MSAIWNPDGSVPFPVTGAQTRVAVASVVFNIGTGIVVTTQAANGYQDGDTIELEGVYNSGSTTVLSAINGVYSIGYINTTQFILNTSATLAATQSNTGFTIDYSVNPVFQLMGDGDALKASNLNPAIQGATNAIPFLYRKSGKYRLHDIYAATIGTARATWSSTTTTSTSYISAISATGLLSSDFSTYPSPPIADLGDIMVASITVDSVCSTVGQSTYMTLGLSTNGGPYSPLSLVSEHLVDNGATSTPIFRSFTLSATVAMFASGTFNFAIMVSGITSLSTNSQLAGVSQITVHHYRVNK
jgi:hypothetical protein